MTNMNVMDKETESVTDLVHLVNFTESLKSPRIVVLEARAEGSTLKGLCGHEFVPNRNSNVLFATDDTCHDCKVALIDLTHDQMMKSWWTR